MNVSVKKSGASAGGSGADGQVEGDEDEESSSSSLNFEISDELHRFQKEWRQEIDANGDPELENDRPDLEQQALALFFEGVKDEEQGRLYEAIVKYKKALHLMPDVEKKAFDLTSKSDKVKAKQQHRDLDLGLTTPEEKTTIPEGGNNVNDLTREFTSLTLEQNFVCLPESTTSMAHISCLPMEVLIQIIKWVVSSDLDTRSLENLSEVCRGFYLASRSSDVWRLVCLRTWGLATLPLAIQMKVTDNDWRSFFLSRPRVHLNGCYISKMTYMREGERSFTDHQFFRAWHIVQYYRLIRFFPGGYVLMTTTPDNPSEAVKNMHEGLIGSYTGRFQTIDNRVACVVKKTEPPAVKSVYKRGRNGRRNSQQYVFEVPDQVLHFELEIRGKKHKQLHWISYAVTNKYRSTGKEQTTHMDVHNPANYPPLYFSLVRSYQTSVITGPLEC